MKKNYILLCCILLIAGALSACSEKQVNPITDSGELLAAIENADGGAVISVGDIDFSLAPGVSNELARVALKKDVQIKSGYANRNALFTNASFNITGSKYSGDFLECSFSGITFDGGVCARELSAEDWELPLDSDGAPRLNEPEKAQYALSFGGNVSARFDGCIFRNYMYENGPVMLAYYGDYTGNSELVGMFDDYSSCELNIALTDCEIAYNAALFGGAIYLDGNNNVTFSAEDCAFSDNYSGCGEFSEGGGACRFNAVDAALLNCRFEGNEGNHCYIADLDKCVAEYKKNFAESDEIDRSDYYYLADSDRTQGGAIFSRNGSLMVSDCEFSGNRASLGGAIRIINTSAQLEDCVFNGNEASAVAINPYDECGPWSMMGLGGAIYIDSMPGAPVSVYTSDFIGNTAQNGYGSVYGFWTNEYKNVMPLGFGSIDLYSCTIKDNLCLSRFDYGSGEIYPWASHPGNILDIEYLNLHGCVFTDEVFENDFPVYELPSAENEYNYISATNEEKAEYSAASEIKVPEKTRSLWYNGKKDISENAEKSGAERSVIMVFLILGIIAAAAAVFEAFSSRRKEDGAVIESDIISAAETTAAKSQIFFSETELEGLKNNIVLRQILTDREMDVMRQYISGSSRSQLAEKLMISEATAKTHISNIYAKLEVRSKKELMQKLKTL